MKKRILALLLTLCMAGLPLIAAAVPSTEIYVGNTDVSAGGYWLAVNGVLTDAGASADNYNVKYAGGKLTLNGAVLTGQYLWNEQGYQELSAGIFANGELEIELLGENSITVAGRVGDRASYGVYANGGLVFSGTGKLTAQGGPTDNTGDQRWNAAIYASGAIRVEGAAKLTAVCGAAVVYSCGIYAGNGIELAGSGEVRATGSDAAGISSGSPGWPGRSVGIYAYRGDITVSGSGGVTAVSGDTGGYDCTSYGLYTEDMDGDIIISGSGKVTAGSGDADNSYAICAGHDVTFSGRGEVEATGGSGERSAGVYAENDLTVSGTGRLTAVGDNADFSYGIYVDGDMSVPGSGEIDATGGDGPYCGISVGIYSYGTLDITGAADVSAQGGDAADTSAGFNCEGVMTLAGGGNISGAGGAEASGLSCGIYAATDVRIRSGNVLLTCEETRFGDSYGICRQYTGIGGNPQNTVTGGTLTAEGDSRALERLTEPAGSPVIRAGANAQAGAVSASELTAGLSGFKYVYISYGTRSLAVSASASTVTAGGTVTLTASPTNIPDPAYQWYSNTKNSTVGGVAISGATGVSCTASLSEAGTEYFYCIAGNVKSGNAVGVSVTPAPIEYVITEGMHGIWTQGQAVGLAFTASGDYGNFTGVAVDNSAITDYTGAPGSTVVTLSAGYLSTLLPGRHTLRVIFTDGYADTDFTVMAPSAVTHDYNPPTGERGLPALWLCALLLSGAGLAFAAIKRARG